MNRIVDRVRKLIALSASTDEPEGRSAALMACRLIREHDLRIEAKPGARPAGPAPRRARPRVTHGPYHRGARAAGRPRCSECGEPIADGDAFVDAQGLYLHGDCIPSGERP